MHIVLNYSDMSETRKSRKKLSLDCDDSSTCTLCNGHHTQFSTPSSWKSEDPCRYVFNLKISANSPVCGACRKEVSRSLADQTYILRWVKRIKNADSTCSISLCKQNIFASLKKATSEDLYLLHFVNTTIIWCTICFNLLKHTVSHVTCH